ncbi:hypothetical protein BURCENBC7_AP7449 [Burkholderia cenocepacia BC7]|nr:hypothetical protein BURCENK562V_C0906 [Burkholderia cenocepacia K56-2Valvano]ERI30276.1 hypothetical protein BURCENBC7_AP7449 [Burkholderia cenocepacia BC7]CDN60704.1 hypothetical protein I35_2181 [Burkholderia cenocepacia H111]
MQRSEGIAPVSAGARDGCGAEQAGPVAAGDVRRRAAHPTSSVGRRAR